MRRGVKGRRARRAWILGPACTLGATTHAAFAAVTFGPPEQVGTIQSTVVTEASGLVASRTNPGVFWTHNDRGADNQPRVFAMTAGGADLGTYALPGAAKFDWEDVAVGPGPTPAQQYLYVADTGDNNAARSVINVYRVPEPAVALDRQPGSYTTAPAAAFTFEYPDGARDAETFLVDPVSGDWFVVTKRDARNRVYRAAAPQTPGATGVLEFLGDLDFTSATAGDVSADGGRILLRNYSVAELYERAPGQTLFDALAAGGTEVPLASERQGEGITWDAAGTAYFTTSEGPNAPIFRYDVVPEPVSASALAAAFGLLVARNRGRRSRGGRR